MEKTHQCQNSVLWVLKEANIESDRLIDQFPSDDIEDAWFEDLKSILRGIRDCTTKKQLDEVKQIPKVVSLFVPEKSNTSVEKVDINEGNKAHVHDSKRLSPSEKIGLKKSSKAHKKNSEVSYDVTIVIPKLEESNLQNNKFVLTNTNLKHNKTVHDNTLNSDSLVKKSPIPVAKVTPISSVKKPAPTLIPYEDTKTPVKPRLLSYVPCTPNHKIPNFILSSDNSGKTPLMNRTFNKTVILDKPILNSTFKVEVEDKLYNSSKTRKQSKRKSSLCAEGSSANKRVKVSKDLMLKSAQKTPIAKLKVKKLEHTKSSLVYDQKKLKLSAVIIPPSKMPAKINPAVLKEQQIKEELKKKEEKAKENRKRVLEERKLKAEESKKKREEKTENTLKKRLKMEREKQEKHGVELQKAPNVKEAVKNNRVKELVEQSTVKTSKSGVLTSSTKSNGNPTDVRKTPVSQKSDEIESYELTPVPDSSTYNFSDDEDERPTGKKIPVWAHGTYLKSCLIQHHYCPANVDEIFGTVIDPPNLAKIFGIVKQRYNKRTSSANWNTPPKSLLS